MEQFRKVEASGVDLGWIKGRKLSKYLAEIPEKIEQAKASADQQKRAEADKVAKEKAEAAEQEKAQAAKQKAEALRLEVAQRRAQAEKTYSAAEELYKAGQLQKALEQFRKVEASGAALGWMETRKLKRYLEKIPGQVQLAATRAKEQKQATAQAKSEAASQLKASRESLANGRFEDARKRAVSVRKVKGLEDEVIEREAASLLAEIDRKEAEALLVAKEQADATKRKAAERKAQAEQTFKAALERYEAGDLEKALEQFRKVESSDVDLGPLATRRLNRHLSRLPGQIQEAKAQAEEQRLLAEQACAQATSLLKASRDDLSASRLGEAREKAKSAREIKGLTDADLLKQASALLAEIDSKEAEANRAAREKEETARRERDRRKAEAQRVFEEAEQLYRGGHLEQAQQRFVKVQESGVTLGFLTDRKLETYLRRLPDEIQEAKARAKAQKQRAEAARAQALSLVQSGRDNLTAKRLDAALADAKAAQKVEHLADTELTAQAGQLVTAVRQAQAALEREAQQRQAEAVRLFDEGMSLYEARRFKEAKEKLTKAQGSGIDIGNLRQRKLGKALAGIDEDIVRGQFDKARRLAQSILESEAAGGSMKQRARQMLAQIDLKEAAALREATRRKLEMGQTFAEAVDLRRQGRLEEALTRFTKVKESGANLGLLDARKLDRYLKELPVEIEEAKARTAKQRHLAEQARTQALALIKQSRDLLAARRYDEAAQSAEAAAETDRLVDKPVKQQATALLNEIRSTKAKAKGQAEQTFARAIDLYSEGKYQEAQKLLTEVQQSGVPLGMLEDRKLKNLVARIPRDVQEAKAREAERKALSEKARAEATSQLKKSRNLLAAERYDEAAHAARAIDKMEHLDDGALKQQTVALLREIETKTAEASKKAERRREEMRQLLSNGIALVEDRKFKEAKEVLTKVAQSGVDLSWADSRKLKSTLEDIEEYVKPVDEAALRQAQADLASSRSRLDQGSFTSARDLALAVRKSRNAVGYEIKQEATALLTKIDQKEKTARLEASRKAEELKAKMEQLYAQGVRLYENGKLEEAKTTLTEVQSSGVLGERKLSSVLAKIETDLAAQRKVRADLAALQEIMAEIKVPEADENAQREAKAALDAARATLAQGKFGAARLQARGVSESIKAIGEDTRQEAVGLLAEIDKKEAQAKARAEQLAGEMKQLFDQAVRLERDGQIKKAHEAFVKIDKSGVELGWLENQKLRGYLKRLPEAIAEAKEDEAERHRVAKQARTDALACIKLSREHLDAKRFDKAREFAQAARSIRGLDHEQVKQQAKALLSEIDQKETAAAGQAKAAEEAAKRMYVEAKKCYESGELAKAHQLFTEVERSGVELGWLENQKLKGYLKRLPDALAEAKEDEAERQRVAGQARTDALACLTISREHLEAKRFDEAHEFAKAAGATKGLGDEQVKQQATALLAEIDRKETDAIQQTKAAKQVAERDREQRGAAAKQKYVEAQQRYESGELEKALQLFTEVEKSGTDLGWLENRKLKGYLKRLPEAIAEAKEKGAERQLAAKQALERAQALLRESRDLLTTNRYDEARKRAKSVAKIKELDDQEAKQQASTILAEIETKEAAARAAAAQAEQDFARAVDLYKAGQLAEAQKLFIHVRDTGADLGRRGNRALESYLEKLPEEIQAAKDRGAERVRIAQAASSQAQALLKASRELLTTQQFDEALAKAGAAGKVEGLTDEKLKAEAKAVTAQIQKAMAAAPKATPENIKKAQALYGKAVALCEAGNYNDAKPVLQEAGALKQALSWLKRRKLEHLLASIDENIAEQQQREKAKREVMQAREREAAGMYKQVLAAMGAQQYQRAQQLIERLKSDYSDTEFIKKVQ